MALATSGALTLDQIHVEAGGTTGTTCSLNDSDIRGLTAASGRTINSTLGTNIDFADFYGASSAVQSTLTTGYYHFSLYTINWRYRGYNKSQPYGSMSPIIQNSNIANNNELIAIYVFGVITQATSGVGIGDRRIYAHFDGTNTISNTNSSAFTSVTINGTTFNRSDATFSIATGPQYHFYWDESGGGYVNNNTAAIPPFPAVGSTCTISFT
tara:strand:- start:1068 stop:1703 length:636 start_codon:yes stop_codon:yes gene_type:complete